MCAKHFLIENVWALQVFLCALISWPVCARTRAQLRLGNIAQDTIAYYSTAQNLDAFRFFCATLYICSSPSVLFPSSFPSFLPFHSRIIVGPSPIAETPFWLIIPLCVHQLHATRSTGVYDKTIMLCNPLGLSPSASSSLPEHPLSPPTLPPTCPPTHPILHTCARGRRVARYVPGRRIYKAWNTGTTSAGNWSKNKDTESQFF